MTYDLRVCLHVWNTNTPLIFITKCMTNFNFISTMNVLQVRLRMEAGKSQTESYKVSCWLLFSVQTFIVFWFESTGAA